MTNDKNQKIIFPANITEIIFRILKKYGLETLSKETVARVAAAKTAEEKKEILENLPDRKIVRIIREAAENKTSAVPLASELKKQLNLSNDVSKKLAKELEEKLLKEVVEPLQPSGPPGPEKPDVYREPIE